MKKMKAMILETDGHLKWTEVPQPQIREAEVLLEIHAAGMNRADLLQRAGQYPPPKGWPDYFGLEAAVKQPKKENGKLVIGCVHCWGAEDMRNMLQFQRSF